MTLVRNAKGQRLSWSPADQSDSGAQESPKKKILVVEDEKDLRDFVSIVLRRHGYEVHVASNGAEALLYLRTLQPDLIFFDLKMPVMSGRDFVSEYRQVHAGAGATLVVMTAADDARHRADEIGVEALLVKPFGIEDLLSSLRRHLG